MNAAFVLFLLVGILLTSGCTNTGAAVVIHTSTGSVEIPVEIVDTPEERQVGLMNRESLVGGMLFVFDQEQALGFWMKDTLIPLDILFLNKEKEIVDIQTMVPCSDPCPMYHSREQAQYALEVNAGFAEEYGIAVGDRVSFTLQQ